MVRSLLAAGKKDGPAEKLDPKDAWKETFELREIETGLASVDKVVQETAVGVGVDARVRIKTPAGPVLGRVASVEGTKLKVVTDSGLKFTVEAKDAEPVVEPPRIVVKQAPKQG